MGMTETLVGAIVAALTGAYFLATFAFVAYALTKYNDLKDDLRRVEARLDGQLTWEKLVKVRGRSTMDDAPLEGGRGDA